MGGDSIDTGTVQCSTASTEMKVETVLRPAGTKIILTTWRSQHRPMTTIAMMSSPSSRERSISMLSNELL